MTGYTGHVVLYLDLGRAVPLRVGHVADYASPSSPDNKIGNSIVYICYLTCLRYLIRSRAVSIAVQISQGLDIVWHQPVSNISSIM